MSTNDYRNHADTDAAWQAKRDRGEALSRSLHPSSDHQVALASREERRDSRFKRFTRIKHTNGNVTFVDFGPVYKPF